MHELQITESILNIVLQHAQRAGAKQVVSIRLTIGELSDLENDWLQKYFDYISKNTIAEKALLQIERVGIQLRCDACNESFALDRKNELANVRCPTCQGEHYTIVAGREYRIEDIKVV